MPTAILKLNLVLQKKETDTGSTEVEARTAVTVLEAAAPVIQATRPSSARMPTPNFNKGVI
jgi:hypothetical protein